MHRSDRRKNRILTALCLTVLLLVACDGGHDDGRDVQPQTDIRVLLIGNSYTFANELPEMLAELARSGGHEVEVAMSAQGGWTLDMHSQSAETLEKLEQKQWDYVVLQEQSVLPAQAEERERSMYPAVRLLQAAIDGNGAEAILFMTWGRRDGLSSPGFQDFGAMQAELESGYMRIADELDALVAPVGIAWQKAIERDSGLGLWSADGSHPSETGSYLTASVFYAVIFQQSPEGLGYMAGLPEDLGRFLQRIAEETVLEDTERWNIR